MPSLKTHENKTIQILPHVMGSLVHLHEAISMVMAATTWVDAKNYDTFKPIIRVATNEGITIHQALNTNGNPKH
jgi:hypothetical protein